MHLSFFWVLSDKCELGGSDGEAGSEFLHKALCLLVNLYTYPHLWSQEEENGHKYKRQKWGSSGCWTYCLWLAEELSNLGEPQSKEPAPIKSQGGNWDHSGNLKGTPGWLPLKLNQAYLTHKDPRADTGPAGGIISLSVLTFSTCCYNDPQQEKQKENEWMF